MKTLVVRLDHLGDILLTTPLVRALAHAGHAVDVLVPEAFAAIFDHSPYTQECFSIEQVAPGFPNSWWKLGQWLCSQKYDLIVLPYAKEKRLCFASACSGARQRIAMWGGFWGRLTLHRCLRSEILTQPRPFSQILLRCAEAVGAPSQGLRPDLFLTESERAVTLNLLPPSLAGRTLIGLHPGSAGNACNLPASVYADLAALILAESEYGVILTGTANEADLFASWPNEVMRSERVWNTVGQLDLRHLAAVVAEMAAYVCSSTGPLHVASALGIATVSPFCPSIPLNAAIWGNFGAPASVVEPQVCPRISGRDACCDFNGQIPAARLFSEIQRVLALAPSGIGP